MGRRAEETKEYKCISSYTNEEKEVFKKEWKKVLTKGKLKKEYNKRWHPKKVKKKRELKKGEWKGKVK